MKTKLSLKHSGIAFVLSFIISQAVVFIFSYLAGYILTVAGVKDIETIMTSSPIYLSLATVMMQLSFLGIFLYFKKHYEMPYNVVGRKKLNIRNILLFIALGIFSIFALSGIVNYFELFLRVIKYPVADMPYAIDSWGNYLIGVVALCITPAICEELLFRGVVISGLREKGEVFAIIVSAIMFSIFHLSATQFIYPILFGILLAVILVKTNNIYYCMLVHGFNNFFSLTMQFINTSQTSEPFAFSISSLLFALIFVALWIFVIITLYKSKLPNSKATDTQSVVDESTSQQTETQQNDTSTQSAQNITSPDANKSKIIFITCMAIMSLIWVAIFISELV